MNQVLAWHFLAANRQMQYGACEVVKPGETYTAKGDLVMCSNGMHASRRILDALSYAPGPVVCRVRLSGEIQEEADKLVARTRRVLWIMDASRILHEFACCCAEDALRLVRKPDPRSVEAVRVRRLWLDGKATDEELRKALAAAWSAARAVARTAAMDAAWATAVDAAVVTAVDAAVDTTWDAAVDTAWDAAVVAARATARAAARATAMDTARATARAVARAAARPVATTAAWDAAWSAAWSAARVAARAAQNKLLTKMVMRAHSQRRR
jgi:hypothetical protein